MKKLPFPLFLTFMLFLIWFTFNRTRMNKKGKKLQDDFWELESQANATRKQSLDGLPYLNVPLQELPFMETDDDELAAIQEEIRQVAKRKIVNFTGISNTELKLKYGAPNLDALSEFDNNYTTLVQILYRWGQYLSEHSFQKEAICVLEYGVSCNTDIRGHYLLLANLYLNTSQSSKIQSLIDQAETLNSLNRNSIIRGLLDIQLAHGLPEGGHARK